MPDKKFLFLLINFESYPQLKEYLVSIDQAAGRVHHARIEVWIADNTETDPQEILFPAYTSIRIHLCPYHQNSGYFGGANRLMKEVGDLAAYDYVAISNVDILLPLTFFEDMLKLSVGNDIGWIAPAIYSKKEELDRNPELVYRPSAGKLRSLMVMYKYDILIRLYNRLLYRLRRKKKVAQARGEAFIYAGHGSFILLTGAFLRCKPSLEYPCFLFGEEIFLAELIRAEGLRVLYVPSIRILDIDHIATSKIDRKTYFRLKYQSVSYLYHTFFHSTSTPRLCNRI